MAVAVMAELPSVWVQKFIPCIPRNAAPVLDLACGNGRHARLLRQHEYAVLALDKNPAAFLALQEAGITTQICDLEQAGQGLPLADASLAGIVVCNYLHRPLFTEFVRCLQPGGVLIYETFMLGQQAYGKPGRAEFLLLPDELLQFAQQHQFEVLGFTQGVQTNAAGGLCVRQALCAVKP